MQKDKSEFSIQPIRSMNFSSFFLPSRRPVLSVLAAGCLAAAAAGTTGCTNTATTAASPQTGSTAAPAAFFATHPTFDFLPDPSLEAAGAVSNRPYWAKRIRDTIAADLSKKGYRRVRGSGASMLLAYHIVRQTGDATSVNSNYTGYKLTDLQQSQANLNALVPPSGSGTLVVDVIDPVKKEIVWRTSKQTPLQTLDTADEREKSLGTIVADALSSIPAKS